MYKTNAAHQNIIIILLYNNALKIVVPPTITPTITAAGIHFDKYNVNYVPWMHLTGPTSNIKYLNAYFRDQYIGVYNIGTYYTHTS